MDAESTTTEDLERTAAVVAEKHAWPAEEAPGPAVVVGEEETPPIRCGSSSAAVRGRPAIAGRARLRDHSRPVA